MLGLLRRGPCHLYRPVGNISGAVTGYFGNGLKHRYIVQVHIQQSLVVLIRQKQILKKNRLAVRGAYPLDIDKQGIRSKFKELLFIVPRGNDSAVYYSGPRRQPQLTAGLGEPFYFVAAGKFPVDARGIFSLGLYLPLRIAAFMSSLIC